MSTDKQTSETVYGAIPIDPVAAYQGVVDRLMPDIARKREFEEQQQAIAADLDDDPEFRITSQSDLSRDSVLTVTHIAAVTLEINRVHRCANIEWARKYGQYATGAAAATLKNLVTRTDRIAVHFKLKPSDLLAADEGLDFAVARQWHVPRGLQAKNTHKNERVLPAEAADASDGMEPNKAGPAPLKAETVPDAPPAVALGAPGGVETDKVPPVWSLKTSIERLPGYRWQTYQALQDAHIAGQPCPKAQHLLDTWKLAPPNGLKVIQLPRRDELEYELETGEKKRTTVKQIQAVIQGLLSE